MLTSELFSLFDAPTRDLVQYTVDRVGDAYQLQVLAPGFKKEDFQLDISESRYLTITAKTDVVSKLTNPTFKKAFTLSRNVNTEQVVAKYDGGILTLTLPLKEVKTKASSIKVE